MVDLFYHPRHVSCIVNMTEDAVLVKSRFMLAKLVLEHSQRFTINIDRAFGVPEDMGTGPKWTARVQRKEIGQGGILDATVSGRRPDLDSVRNKVILQEVYPFIRWI